MSGAKHTPGPWVAKRLATYSEPGHVILWPDKGGTQMRRVDYRGNFTAGDAHLVAAARELLQLAQRVASLNPTAGQIGAGMLASLVEDAIAAVAKATEIPL